LIERKSPFLYRNNRFFLSEINRFNKHQKTTFFFSLHITFFCTSTSLDLVYPGSTRPLQQRQVAHTQAVALGKLAAGEGLVRIPMPWRLPNDDVMTLVSHGSS
jgi:hypothetical protein